MEQILTPSQIRENIALYTSSAISGVKNFLQRLNQEYNLNPEIPDFADYAQVPVCQIDDNHCESIYSLHLEGVEVDDGDGNLYLMPYENMSLDLLLNIWEELLKMDISEYVDVQDILVNKDKNFMEKKIFKSVFQFTVLSEDPILECEELINILGSCDSGNYVGGNHTTIVENLELSGKNAVEELRSLGSQPEFFNMDDNGNILDEDDDIE